MRAKFVDAPREYVIDLQLSGHHKRTRLGLTYDEPPLHLLEVEARIFVEGAGDDVVNMVEPDEDRRVGDELAKDISTAWSEQLSYVGIVQAFTFPLVEGVLDDCDADSQGAIEVAQQLCDWNGNFLRHVIPLLGGHDEVEALRTVVCAWHTTLPKHHLAALPLALRQLHMKFGHGVLAFSGSNEHGLYLERFNFRRVRVPIAQIRSSANKSVKLDVKRGAINKDETKTATAKLIEQMQGWQEEAAIWIA